MSLEPVIFTIRATEEWRFVVESKVLPKGRLWLDYRTPNLAMDYPYWYAQTEGVPILIEVRDPDGTLLESIDADPRPETKTLYPP